MEEGRRKQQWHQIKDLASHRVPIAEAKRLLEAHYKNATTQTTRELLLILHALADQQEENLQRLVQIHQMMESILKVTADNHADLRKNNPQGSRPPTSLR